MENQNDHVDNLEKNICIQISIFMNISIIHGLPIRNLPLCWRVLAHRGLAPGVGQRRLGVRRGSR